MLHLGTFAGVPLYLHWTWFILFGFIVLNGPAATFLFLLLLLFLVLHEYGHCLAALYYDLEVDNVTIYPFGGLASMDFKHGECKQEILIALAGPAVNLVFGSLAFLAFWVTYLLEDQILSLLFGAVFIVNAALLTFNLLPIFPMDGGRVLRGTIGLFASWETATLIAVRIGQVFALCLGCLAIYWLQPILFLISLLMFVGAQHELVQARKYACLQRIREKLAEGLNRPEILTAPLSEVRIILEDVQNDELRQRFYSEELIPLLKELEET